jgi:hypothetical protein
MRQKLLLMAWATELPEPGSEVEVAGSQSRDRQSTAQTYDKMGCYRYPCRLLRPEDEPDGATTKVSGLVLKGNPIRIGVYASGLLLLSERQITWTISGLSAGTQKTTASS